MLFPLFIGFFFMNRISLHTLKHDLPASIVVYLVALPLCLGIALASGAPPFAGIISGIVGGVVVGFVSGSQVSVSGPAAGLTTIVAAAIGSLVSYEVFLATIVLAGVIQLCLGFARAGILAQFIPNSVIKGMLAAIGLILILKQIPHAVGYDDDFEGDFAFEQPDHQNTISELLNMFNYLNWGAVIIAVVSIGIIIFWGSGPLRKYKFFELVPAPLIVVVVGVLINSFFAASFPSLFLSESGKHLVNIPFFNSVGDFFKHTSAPDFSKLLEGKSLTIAVQLALVASLESLLSIEASDKIDKLKRISPPNRELVAQGAGNIVAGLLGGIPVTAVIVRSSANINAGSRTKLSAILHGAFLLLSVMFIPFLINKIPFASLAAILLMTGYKLTKPALFVQEYRKGWNALIPFVITIVAIMFSDLLVGVFIGLITGIIFTFRTNYRSAFTVSEEMGLVLINFKKDIFFINKGKIKNEILKIKKGSRVVFDMTSAEFIDNDVLEIINDFIAGASEKNITVSLKMPENQTYGHKLNIANFVESQ